MKASDALVRQMERLGVDVIFGIPGGANLPFYDSLYDSNILSILMKHEQHAIHAAEGYARVRRRPGIASATSGPGATNLITGIVDAWMDSTPIVAITGQVVRQFMGSDAFQEADIVGLVLPHIKYGVTVMDSNRLVQEFVNAYYSSMSGRPGPTLLDVPRDVFQGDIAFDEGDVSPEPGFVKTPPTPSTLDIERAADLIAKSKTPIILAGGGVYSSRAEREVLELAQLIGAPILTTTPGKISLPEDHPLVLGVVGMHGRIESDMAAVESDMAICVGTRLSDRAIGVASDFQRNRLIIHIDIDPSELGKNVTPTVSLPGEAKAVLRALLDRLATKDLPAPDLSRVERLKEIGRNYDEYMMSQASDGKIYSWKVVQLLREELPRDAIVTTGVGQHQMWAQLFFRVLEPGTFITSSGLGTMGFGLPAAFGAKTAAPDRIVVDMDGDGSFLMTCQTLASISEYDFPVITVVFDNRSLGMVRQWQALFYRRRFKDTDIPDRTNMVKIAEAFGVEGVFGDSYDVIRRTVRRAVRNNEAVMIDIPIDKDEKVFPMVPPGRWLADVIPPPGFESRAKVPAPHLA